LRASTSWLPDFHDEEDVSLPSEVPRFSLMCREDGAESSAGFRSPGPFGVANIRPSLIVSCLPAKIVEETALRERTLVFQDRQQGGSLLAERLRQYATHKRALILAVAAGGVPVGQVVAKDLGVPMEAIVVRKIQVPWSTESGFGAVSFDGDIVLNLPLVGSLGLSEKEIRKCITRATKVVRERVGKFRGDRPLPDFERKVVILVDDGLASGYTMLAALRSVKRDRPQKVVVATPTGSLSAVELLSPETDEIVCLNIRGGPFFAVADAYRNWYDVTDEEVLEILKGLESMKP